MRLSDILPLLHQLRFKNATQFNQTSVLDVLKELAPETVADHVYSQTIEVTLIMLYSSIAAIGFVSNAFILLVILTSKILRSNPSNLLLANLMLSDILKSFFCIPFTLIWFIRRSWFFGESLCKVIPFLQGLSIFLSSSTIATIAIDRMIRVTGNVITSRSAVQNYLSTQITIEIIAIWTGSALMSLPILLSQELVRVSLSEFSLDELQVNEYVRCVDNMVRWERLSYTSAILVAQYLIPVTILMFANFKIMKHLQRNLDRLTQTASSNFQAESNSQADRNHLMREMKRNQKVMRTLSRLTGSFMLTWLPLTLVNVYVDIAEPDIGDKLSLTLVLCHVTAMTSVPLNAFLYGWSNPIVREEASRTWSLITEIRGNRSNSNNSGSHVNRSGITGTINAPPIRTSENRPDVPL